jgi:hypothetical protein
MAEDHPKTDAASVGFSPVSGITGVLFFSAFFGIATGSQFGRATLVFVTLAFTATVVLVWTWLSLVAVRLMDELPGAKE